MSLDLLKLVNKDLPHVKEIWVDNNGNYNLVAVVGCTKFSFDDEEILSTETLAQEKTVKPNKRK
jgi:hypothetical protein